MILSLTANLFLNWIVFDLTSFLISINSHSQINKTEKLGSVTYANSS